MKRIHETTYYLYKDLKKEIKALILSDLHFSDGTKDSKLSSIINYVVKEKPDYIFMPGDFIDSTNVIKNENNKKRLYSFLEKIASVAKVMISIGGHDLCSYDETKDRWLEESNLDFFKEIDALKNVSLLDNEAYEDDYLYVAGLTQSYNYYYKKEYRKKNIFKPLKENKEDMLKDLCGVQKKLITNLSKNKLKIALIHSPMLLEDVEVKEKLNEFDYIISGHMHNGCVPPVLYELWPSTKGLIAPNREFFVSNERNTLKNKNDKVIVAGPLTMFQECSRKFQIFNIFYPMYSLKLIITNNLVCNKEKITKKAKYLSLK